MRIQHATFASALGLYLAWTLLTWILEGRVHTLLRPEAVVDRVVYALAGNLLLGIGAGLALVIHAVRRAARTARSAGLGSTRRTLAAVGVGLGLGTGLYALAGPPTTNPVVMLNAFSQVFVVSAAEVVVCWAVVGTALEAALGSTRWRTVLAGLGSAALFGLYHFAHSPPFNTWAMVGFLTIVGCGTGLYFFLSRDVLGTAVFHNFLGMLGVLQALAKANALSTLERLQPALIGTAAVGVATILAFQAMARRPQRPTAPRPAAA